MGRTCSSVVFRVCGLGLPECLSWRPALRGEDFVPEAVGRAGPIVIVWILGEFRAAVGRSVSELQEIISIGIILRFGGCESHYGRSISSLSISKTEVEVEVKICLSFL